MKKLFLLIISLLIFNITVDADTASTAGCYYCANYEKVINATDDYKTKYKYFAAGATLDEGCQTTPDVEYSKTDNLEEACVHYTKYLMFKANGGTFSNGTDKYILGCTKSTASEGVGTNCPWEKDEMKSLISREGFDFDGWRDNNPTHCNRQMTVENHGIVYACWIDKSKTTRGLNSEDILAPENGCYYCVDYEEELVIMDILQNINTWYKMKN